jgi:hypothetical protein
MAAGQVVARATRLLTSDQPANLQPTAWQRRPPCRTPRYPGLTAMPDAVEPRFV